MVVDGKNNPKFEYKNLPEIVEVQTSTGKRLEYPQTSWNFSENDEKKKEFSLDSILGILTLLREHGEF